MGAPGTPRQPQVGPADRPRDDRASTGPAARQSGVTVQEPGLGGDPAAACRAGQSMLEFVGRQVAKLEALGSRRRSRLRAGVDPRLWLDERRWIAWTICGELVSVEDIEPGSRRRSPEVRRLQPHELPAVFAADRLVRSVIALYRGDSLERGPACRYIPHHDLRRALEAALASALAEEERLLAVAPVVKVGLEKSVGPPVKRTKKTRHHPLGNFIVYCRPRPGEDLPHYAALLELTPVPKAFPNRRAAKRFIQRMPRLGLDAEGIVVARVLGCVEVQLVWRPGIRVPREPGAVIELIRREPRVVLPELKAAWLPRYAQTGDGWELERVQKRGTVRSRWNRILLRKVTDEGRCFAGVLEENTIRRCAGSEEVSIVEPMAATLRLVQRAE